MTDVAVTVITSVSPISIEAKVLEKTLATLGKGFKAIRDGNKVIIKAVGKDGKLRDLTEAEAKQFLKTAKAEEHHLMTNKNTISKAAGGPYTQKFEDLAKLRGITLEDMMNRVYLVGHKGPHPEYNKRVYERLRGVTDGLKGDKFNKAFDAELKKIADETCTPGSELNRLATKK